MTATVATTFSTGVDGSLDRRAAVAALTVDDMTKALDKSIVTPKHSAGENGPRQERGV